MTCSEAKGELKDGIPWPVHCVGNLQPAPRMKLQVQHNRPFAQEDLGVCFGLLFGQSSGGSSLPRTVSPIV